MEKPIVDRLVGSRVAQYEVLARIGGGGMGVVYTARDTRLGRTVALKFLPAQWSHDETARQRFVREAQAASATDHQNICTIHDIAATEDGQLFIVMAYYEGETLKQRLSRGPLAVDDALDVATQVAEGLAKAHAHGVVHRDIKPGNLIMTEDTVRIVDFGLAKFADSLQLTIAHTTVGTAAYMSPEQVRGEEVDARSDVWSLGVVLYEMLAGHVPFRGAYAEAIASAIRHETPPPLRALRPEVPEDVEQLVFRALHKDPVVRFQSARELARALRRARGQTLPQDLRTEVVTVPMAGPLPPRRRVTAWTLAVGLLMAIVGTPLWLFSPIERVPVAVLPVVNQTGYAELDAYRLALTQELVAQLADSRSVRVLPYDRLLPIVRRFRLDGRDVSSREILQAITSSSGARVLLVPTVLYENGGWKARVEFRNAETVTHAADPYESASEVSSLMKDSVYGLMARLATGVEEHFTSTGPRRARWTAAVSNLTRRTPSAAAPRMRTLEAAAAFEQGLDAYEQQEYVAALQAFRSAADQEPRSPLPAAWRSRVAVILRQENEAAQAAEQALRLVSERTPVPDRMFVEAVAAESRLDGPTAERHYRELAARLPGEAWPVTELAEYLDRQGRTDGAIAAYLASLTVDARQARPDIHLCRMYNRANEFVKAQEHARRAIASFRAIDAPAGEAQSLLCLADALRTGTPEQHQEARHHAEAALRIFEDHRAGYNVARAYNYIAMIAGIQRNRADAAAFGERALAAARDAGNEILQPLIMMNLGVTYRALGNATLAADYYQQSYQRYEALGDEARAAEIQGNRGALLIDGEKPEEGLRDVLNALAVFQKLGNKDFEAFCLEILALYHHNGGRYVEADRALNQAVAIVGERNLAERLPALNIQRARLRLEAGDYMMATEWLAQAVAGHVNPGAAAEAHVNLGRIHVRLGDFSTARTHFDTAATNLEDGDAGLLPLLHAARGELAYQAGQFSEARMRFSEAAALWSDELPSAASVEARAYLGLLDALDGRMLEGRRHVEFSLQYAQRTGRFGLETLSRVFLARIEIVRGNFENALRTLDDGQLSDGQRQVGVELRAQVHYWRAQALAGRGDAEAALAEERAAREIVSTLRDSLAERYRSGFEARTDVRAILD